MSARKADRRTAKELVMRPHAPFDVECKRHMWPHIPMQPWCEWCVRHKRRAAVHISASIKRNDTTFGFCPDTYSAWCESRLEVRLQTRHDQQSHEFGHNKATTDDAAAGVTQPLNAKFRHQLVTCTDGQLATVSILKKSQKCILLRQVKSKVSQVDTWSAETVPFATLCDRSVSRAHCGQTHCMRDSGRHYPRGSHMQQVHMERVRGPWTFAPLATNVLRRWWWRDCAVDRECSQITCARLWVE